MFQEVTPTNPHIALLDKAIAEARSLPLNNMRLSPDKFYALAKPLIDWQSLSESEKALDPYPRITVYKLNQFLFAVIGSGTKYLMDIPVFAAQNGKIAILAYCIESLAVDINSQAGGCSTLLEHALLYKNLDSIQFLLGHEKIDPNRSMYGRSQSPFELAVLFGNDQIASRFVTHPDFKLPIRFDHNYDGTYDPLTIVIKNNLLNTATLLLEHNEITIKSEALRSLITGKKSHPLLPTVFNHPYAQHLGFTYVLLLAMRHHNDDAVKLILSNPQRKLESTCLFQAIKQKAQMNYIVLLMADSRVDIMAKLSSEILTNVSITALEYTRLAAEALAASIGNKGSAHSRYQDYIYFNQLHNMLENAHLTLFYQDATVNADTALTNLKSKHACAKITVSMMNAFILDKVKSNDPEMNISNIRAEIEVLNNTTSALSAFFSASQRNNLIHELEAKISQIQQEQTALILPNVQGTSSSLIFSNRATSDYYRAPRIDSIEKENILLEADNDTKKTKRQEKLLHSAEMRGMTNNRL